MFCSGQQVGQLADEPRRGRRARRRHAETWSAHQWSRSACGQGRRAAEPGAPGGEQPVDPAEHVDDDGVTDRGSHGGLMPRRPRAQHTLSARPYGRREMTRTTPATGTGAPPRAGSWHAGGGAGREAASGGPLCGVHPGGGLQGGGPRRGAPSVEVTMAYLLHHFWPGGTEDQYRATQAAVHPGSGLPGGVLVTRLPRFFTSARDEINDRTSAHLSPNIGSVVYPPRRPLTLSAKSETPPSD